MHSGARTKRVQTLSNGTKNPAGTQNHTAIRNSGRCIARIPPGKRRRANSCNIVRNAAFQQILDILAPNRYYQMVLKIRQLLFAYAIRRNSFGSVNSEQTLLLREVKYREISNIQKQILS